MTATKDISSRDQGKVGGWVHFGIAVAILAVSTVGFQSGINRLEWATQKQAVPWPEGVTVDRETFRWENMPTELGGRFVLAEDGELLRQTDGKPDGETILEDDVMSTLGIGTGWDQAHHADRRSNWYIIRVYRDNTRPTGHPLRYWRLEAYYYTGALDTVPHTPERCLVAGGATLVGSAELAVTVPKAIIPWNGPLAVRRTLYELQDQNDAGMSVSQFAQYYIFSLNGRPESSWETVRLTLAAPWVRYCYFSKIQFYPYTRHSVTDLEDVDSAAREFMDCFLPAVLRAFPMPADIKALESSDKSTD